VAQSNDDLFSLLLAQYTKATGLAPTGDMHRFVTASREYLDKNQPVSVEFVAGASMSLRLQDNTVVPLVTNDKANVMGNNGWVALTGNTPQPGRGIHEINTPSFDITGPNAAHRNT
jgi:hypothetical protein